MRESHFWTLIQDEFGSANAGIIASTLELPGLKTTAQGALSQGIDPRVVWAAVCDLHDIPVSQRLGKDVEPRDTGTL